MFPSYRIYDAEVVDRYVADLLERQRAMRSEIAAAEDLLLEAQAARAAEALLGRILIDAATEIEQLLADANARAEATVAEAFRFATERVEAARIEVAQEVEPKLAAERAHLEHVR